MILWFYISRYEKNRRQNPCDVYYILIFTAWIFSIPGVEELEEGVDLELPPKDPIQVKLDNTFHKSYDCMEELGRWVRELINHVRSFVVILTQCTSTFLYKHS